MEEEEGNCYNEMGERWKRIKKMRRSRKEKREEREREGGGGKLARSFAIFLSNLRKGKERRRGGGREK